MGDPRVAGESARNCIKVNIKASCLSSVINRESLQTTCCAQGARGEEEKGTDTLSCCCLVSTITQSATVTNGERGERGRKGEREDEGCNNKITRSLRFIVCTSLWCCWSFMCGTGGGVTKGKGLGHRAQRWGKPKKKPFCLKII